MTQTSTYSTGIVRNAGPFARLRSSIANYRLYRRTLAELEGLNDRELQDLGISRYDLQKIAADSVYRA